MRIDKFLKVSRIIKRRTLANEACSKERVYINGKEAKPGTAVKEGDFIEIKFGEKLIKLRVKKTGEHVAKADASEMYELL